MASALALPAGELGREIALPVLQPHLVQHFARVQGVPANLGRQLHVLQGRQVLDQVVELEHEAHVIAPVGGELLFAEGRDLLAVQVHLPLGRSVHAPQNVQDGGLPRAGSAYDDAELPLLDLKVHIVQGRDLHLACLIHFFHVLKAHESVHTLKSALSNPP